MNAETPLNPPTSSAATEPTSSCACNKSDQGAGPQLVYSIGKLDVRLPSIGIEREFQHRERQLAGRAGEPQWESRGARLSRVLQANLHLGRSVCFIHSVGGLPAYMVRPTSVDVLGRMVDALQNVDQPDSWVLLIGQRGPMALPSSCGGLLIPTVSCDQFYAFTMADFTAELSRHAEPALKSAKIEPEYFMGAARELFERVALSTENIGGTDPHRALNYLLVQHAGPFVAAAQRAQSSLLDSIQIRVDERSNARRIVTVIFTFIDRATAVPERLFARVDVTEEWPFLVESPHGGASPLGLRPYVDDGSMGSAL